MLSTFDSPSRALSCATDLCRDVRSVGAELCAGVHTAEIELRGDDIGGIGAHIAARIEGIAGPGETLASRTVRDLSAGSAFRFEDRGTHSLKGVPDEWQVFAVSPS
jgi:class 3 adenylate cyclase